MRDKSMQEGMGKIDSRGKRERKREERVKGRRGEREKAEKEKGGKREETNTHELHVQRSCHLRS
jgi:hypothetical protein